MAAFCLGALSACGDGCDDRFKAERSVTKTIKNNPELLEYDYKIRAAGALIEQAEFSANPRVSAEIENFAGSGRLEGISNSQLTVSFSQLIELGDKRQLRVKAATEKRKLSEQSLSIVKLRFWQKPHSVSMTF